MTSPARLPRVVLLALALSLASFSASAAQKGAKAKGKEKEEPNRTELLDDDQAARAAFDKSHPGVLPDTKLKAKLPGPNAPAFDWCDVRKDFRVHFQDGGSCWAHSTLAAFEWNWALRNDPPRWPNLSAQPIYDYSGDRDRASPALALRTLLNHGTATLAAYPNTRDGVQPIRKEVPLPYRVIAWGMVNGGTDDLKRALLRHGPLVGMVDVDDEFRKNKGRVVTFSPGERDAKRDHAILIVGWDDRKTARGAWKIQNSWGKRWGDDGFAWVEYGANAINKQMYWLRAQSVHYPLPADTHQKLGAGAAPFPDWTMRKADERP